MSKDEKVWPCGYCESMRRGAEQSRLVHQSYLKGTEGQFRAARELIDAIAQPNGRDFQHAWEEACLLFGRVGATAKLFQKKET